MLLIQVSGIKQISDSTVNMPNQNGIQIPSGFNKERDYICGFSDSDRTIGSKGDKVKAIAYNLQINTAGRPMDIKTVNVNLKPAYVEMVCMELEWVVEEDCMVHQKIKAATKNQIFG